MKPKLPMCLEELPQQKIYLVKGLPERPAHFPCGFATCGHRAPEGIAPKRMPRTARYLGIAEWAWSPMHSRVDAYYLSTNRQRAHWLLWLLWHNDDVLPWRWEHTLYAFVPKRGIPARTAAVHLLAEAWKNDIAEMNLDRFHWLGDPGLLDIAEFQAIGDAVWGSQQ